MKIFDGACLNKSCTCHTEPEVRGKKHPEHICRFNDGEQTCECYDSGFIEGLTEALTLLPNPNGNFKYLSEDVEEFVRQVRKAIQSKITSIREEV